MEDEIDAIRTLVQTLSVSELEIVRRQAERVLAAIAAELKRRDSLRR